MRSLRRPAAAAPLFLLMAACASVGPGSASVDSLGQKLSVAWGVAPESVAPIIDELGRHIELRAYLECLIAQRGLPIPDMAGCRRWLDLAPDMPRRPYGGPPPPPAHPAPEAATLRKRLMAREGGPLLDVVEGHCCWGHAVTDAERDAGYFNPESGGRIAVRFPLTASQCAALLDEDVAEARTEAVRVFGAGDDARTELCFWAACARLFAGLDGAELAAAVRASDALGADPARRAWLADALEAAA